MMFADDPADPTDPAAPAGLGLLDWQLPHGGPAAEDLAMFLCQSLPVDLRRRHETALVRRWHAAVRARIDAATDPAYPVELAYAHYRRMALYATLYPVIIGGTMDTANERGLALNTAMAARSFSAASTWTRPSSCAHVQQILHRSAADPALGHA